MTENSVLLTIENQIAYVTLNRAEKHNALNMSMFYQIDNVIKQLKNNRNIRVVIVRGKGCDFCSGLDIKSVMKSPLNILKLLFKWLPGRSNLAQRVSTGWRTIPVPVIMVLHGRVWGGGLQIALGADFRFAQSNSEFSIMEAKWGLIPDMGGTLALKEHLPVDQAKLLAMTGKELSASQALEYKLITSVSDDPLEQALTLATELSDQSPDAIAGVKKLYNNAWWNSARFALAKESFYQIKIILNKNQAIKSFNQTHESSLAKRFKKRMHW